MKRAGRLLFDLVGGAFALLGVIMGLYLITGNSIGNFSIGDLRDSFHEGTLVYYLTIIGTGLGALGFLALVWELLSIFANNPHGGLTVFIWIVGLAAAGMVVYGLIETSSDSFMDSLKGAIGVN